MKTDPRAASSFRSRHKVSDMVISPDGKIKQKNASGSLFSKGYALTSNNSSFSNVVRSRKRKDDDSGSSSQSQPKVELNISLTDSEKGTKDKSKVNTG